MSEETEFVFPEMRIGDLALVGADPTSQDESMGFVVNVKARGVDCIVLGPTGLLLRRNCWHRDDPRCKTHLEVFHAGDRGVFRLAPAEAERRTLLAKVAGLSNMCEDLVARVAMLDRTVPPQAETPKPAKRRGRPKKVPPTADD